MALAWGGNAEAYLKVFTKGSFVEGVLNLGRGGVARTSEIAD